MVKFIFLKMRRNMYLYSSLEKSYTFKPLLFLNSGISNFDFVLVFLCFKKLLNTALKWNNLKEIWKVTIENLNLEILKN